MTVRQRGTAWQADLMIKGERFRFNFDTEEQAEQWELSAKQAGRAGKPIPKPKVAEESHGSKGYTMQQLFVFAMKHHFEQLPRSLKSSTINCKAVMSFLGPDKLVTSITDLDIADMAAHFRELGNSDATVNRKMAAVSKMLEIAISPLGIISKKPAIPLKKERAGRIRYLEVEEERLMLQTAILWGEQDVHDLVAVAIDTGARQGELLIAKWRDINLKKNTWTIWENKADHPRTIPLTARAVSILARRRGGTTNVPSSLGPFSDLSKDGVRHRYERIVSHLQLDDVVFHTLRHTTASRLVQRAIDLRRVQVFMGHRSITTTLRYAHLAPTDLLEAKSALELQV